VNILAVDPSSTRSGTALFIDDRVVQIGHHMSDKKNPLEVRLRVWGHWLNGFRAKTRVDYVAILKASMSRNINTVRMIAYFEATALYMAGQWNAEAYLINDKSARKKAFDNGALTKEEVYDILSIEYTLNDFKAGGSDESDAITAGLACLEDHRRA